MKLNEDFIFSYLQRVWGKLAPKEFLRRLRSASTLEFYLQGTAAFSVLPELPHRVTRKILSAHFFFQCRHSVEEARPVQERASQLVLEMSSRSEGTRACMTSHALLCGRVAFGSFPPTVEEVTRSAARQTASPMPHQIVHS
ncbi:unnamed protein product [Symbiodinium microadriaticum]|nr:unnamed protein product [Symbiodinium microadriaticum]